MTKSMFVAESGEEASKSLARLAKVAATSGEYVVAEMANPGMLALSMRRELGEGGEWAAWLDLSSAGGALGALDWGAAKAVMVSGIEHVEKSRRQERLDALSGRAGIPVVVLAEKGSLDGLVLAGAVLVDARVSSSSASADEQLRAKKAADNAGKLPEGVLTFGVSKELKKRLAMYREPPAPSSKREPGKGRG